MGSLPAPDFPPASRGLESLPDELLVEIARHLEPHDTSKRSNLRSLSLTSHTLLAACNRACTTLSLAGLKAARLPRLLARFPDVAVLNLGFLFDCSEDTLVAIGRRCRRLTELHAPDTFKPDSPRGPNGGSQEPGRGLQSVCRGCPRLAHLALPSYKGPEASLLALEKCRELRVLHLKAAENLSDVAVARIVQRCRRIAELDLSFNAITDAALASIGAHLQHLARLDLKHCKNVTGAGIAHVARGCVRLQALHLGVLALDDEGLLALGQHSRELEELWMDYGTGARGVFSQEALGALAQGCKRLRVLSLRGSKQVDDQSLRGLAKGCPSLEELDLHACANVGDVGLHSVVLGCKKLKSLSLTGTEVGPAGKAAFAGGLPHLATLRLDGQLITDDVLQSVAEYCPALEELHLSGCKVSDTGLEAVVRRCPRLHTLSVKSCADVKGTAFAVGPLPLLHTVQLPSCGVTDQGLMALAQCAPKVVSLTLSNCTKLTAEGCATALRSCAVLHSLVIAGCPQFSREDVLRLTRAARLALKTVRVSRPGSMDDEYTLKRQSAGWVLPSWARGSLGTSASAKY